MRPSPRRLALTTTLIYVALGATWIVASDLVVAASEGTPIVLAAMVKGLAFIAVTGLVLYLVLVAQLRRWHEQASARERLEAERARREEELENYISHAPVGVIVMHPDGRLADANAEALRTLGRDLEAARALGPLGALAPDDAERSVREMAAMPVGVPHESQVTLTRPDGARVFVRQRAVRLRDGRVLSFGFDVTGSVERDAERERAEAALRASEERFRLLAQMTGEIFWMAEPGGRTLYVSPAYEAIWGRTCASLLAAPRSWLEAVHAADRPRVRATLRELAAARSIEVEFRIARPDGEERWINSRAYARVDDGGAIVMISGVATDITERKRALDKLRKLSRAVEQSASAIFITDTAGAIEYVNRRFIETMGYSLDEVRGKNPRMFQSGATPRGEYERLWVTITRGQEWRGELVNRAADGRLLTLLVTISPIIGDDGATTHFLAVQEDVTERRRVEREARESEARFRTLIESVPAGLFVAAGGRFEFLNRAAAELLGAPSPDALVGSEVLERFTAESRARVAERLGALHREGRPWSLAEERCVTMAGDVIEIEVSGVELARAGERAALVFFRDIGDRRRLEAQLRQAQKLEAVGTLAGGIAHDFNNLLTVIQSGASLLQTPEIAADETAAIAGEIRDASERAAALTRQLLLFSRMERIVLADVDLDAMVSNFARMLRRIVGERITLRTVHGSDLPIVRGDVGMLEQVLMNLVVNARDAMPQGGELEIRTEGGVLDEAAATAPGARPGPYAGLIVSDTGIGMTPEVLAHVFEPFFTTKGVGKGTGLGLSTVYGIVRQHRGWIEIDSAPGRGTTFRVRLPAVAERRATAPSAGAPARAPIDGHETILLVEDEERVRRSTAALLARRGYVVLQARDADEALAAWQRHGASVALLLTDVVMPGELSGSALAARLLAERPSLRVICSSGYPATEDEIPPAAHYLPKPYDLDKLADVVRRVLDGGAPSG